MSPPPPPQGPPPPNVSCAPVYVGVFVSFFVIAALFFIARIYTRIKVLKSFWWDDAILTLAFACAVVEFVTQVIMVRHGYGRHVAYVAPSDVLYSGKIGYFGQLIWIWTVTLVKTSMAILLLRIRPNWFWGMLALAAFQLITGIGVTAAHFTRCSPIAANWNPFLPNVRCWSDKDMAISFYVPSAAFVLSDFIFAILPLTFIYKIRRPMREKVVLVFLMGFGLFASACAAVKMTLLHRMAGPIDPTYDPVIVAIWAHLEEYVGIVAACIPCLKAPFEQALNHFGLLKTKSTTYTVHPKAYMAESDEDPSAPDLRELKTDPDKSDTQLVVDPETGRVTNRRT